MDKYILNIIKKECSNFCKFNINLKDYCSFKIGGSCGVLCIPNNIQQLIKIYTIIKNYSVSYFILGNGTNVLFPDGKLDKILIKLGDNFKKIRKYKNLITCGAGVNMFALNKFLLNNALSGLEWSYGIPGSVGGLVYMNAGAYGHDMSENLKWVKVFEKGKVKKIYKKNLNFSYRFSSIQKLHCIIISACFEVFVGDSEQIKKKQTETLNNRLASQPYELFSAGSVFKRNCQPPPAKIIDDLGLKGKRIGGAMISQKHSGFIVNIGAATCQDVLNLISYVKQIVFENTNFKLEEEIIILGGKG